MRRALVPSGWAAECLSALPACTEGNISGEEMGEAWGDLAEWQVTPSHFAAE